MSYIHLSGECISMVFPNTGLLYLQLKCLERYRGGGGSNICNVCDSSGKMQSLRNHQLTIFQPVSQQKTKEESFWKMTHLPVRTALCLWNVPNPKTKNTAGAFLDNERIDREKTRDSTVSVSTAWVDAGTSWRSDYAPGTPPSNLWQGITWLKELLPVNDIGIQQR